MELTQDRIELRGLILAVFKLRVVLPMLIRQFCGQIGLII
jgi:hypothetical protein